MSCGTVSPSFAWAGMEKHTQRKQISVLDIAFPVYQSPIPVASLTHSISGYGPLPFSVMKRSIRAVTTGSGTEPSSSTASWNADVEFRSKRFLRFFAGAHDRELAPNHREMHAS